MASLVATVVDGYNSIWELRGIDTEFKFLFLNFVSKLTRFFRCTDPRVENWLFMSSPLSTLTICLSYVMIVKVWGPAYMKNRPAFQFRRTLVIYNAIQVIFSTWLFYEVMSTT